MIRDILHRLRYMTDTAGVCPNGHGGHQLDAKFCRICSAQLQRRDKRGRG